MIEVKNLTKKFDHKTVFDKYNNNFEGPGLYFIIGPSGAGKTTLLNIIGGIESFDGGHVKVDEYMIKEKDNQKLWQNVSFVFQNYGLIDNETVGYNLNIGFIKNPSNKAKLEALRQVGLPENYLNSRISSLSGGEQQRVAIARAILRDTKYIFADEPTGNLDKINANNIMEIFQKLSNDKTIIVVTHDQTLLKYGKSCIEI